MADLKGKRKKEVVEEVDDADMEDASEGEEGEKEKKEALSDPLVIEKYKKAAEIANATIQLVVKAAVTDAKVVDLCTAADKYALEQTNKIYNKDKKMEKGLAFPCCISVNNIVGHFSPLAGDITQLKAGDVVKIDVGVQIDGYVAVAAHTMILSGGQAVNDKRADVIAAAYAAADAALRLLRPGNKNTQVTEAFSKIATDFKVSCVQGVLSHQMDRFVLDGEKVIINRTDPEHKVEESEFEPNQVWAIDVVMSTGEGKPQEIDQRTTVYKRNPDRVYQLKRQASRTIFGEILKNHPSFPFTLRSFDEKTARFAIVECYTHDLVQAYPVLFEKEGEFVAHVKFTALITPTGTSRITAIQQDSNIQSAAKVQDETVKQILSQAIWTAAPKKKKNKKKKEKPTGAMDTS